MVKFLFMAEEHQKKQLKRKGKKYLKNSENSVLTIGAILGLQLYKGLLQQNQKALSLGYKSPFEFEEELRKEKEKAKVGFVS
jgi:hypothetical protein